jgi:hypothetical protein
MVFHALVVVLAQLALAAVNDMAGQVVAAFLEVAHPLDLTPVRVVNLPVERTGGYDACW